MLSTNSDFAPVSPSSELRWIGVLMPSDSMQY
jgi:hypothetical protein